MTGILGIQIVAASFIPLFFGEDANDDGGDHGKQPKKIGKKE